MKKGIALDIICSLFILLFVYTAISKLMSYQSFVVSLKNSPLLSQVAGIVAWLLPIIELIAATFLFFPALKKYGLITSLSLMVILTGYLAYMILFVPHLPCSCGGIIKNLTWKQHLVFNSAFTVLAIVGIWLNKDLKNTKEIKEE